MIFNTVAIVNQFINIGVEWSRRKREINDCGLLELVFKINYFSCDKTINDFELGQ